MKSAIILEDISFSYGSKDVLKNINLIIEQGKNIGIIGESGGGKSTLLKLLSGLYKKQTGKIIIDGEEDPEKIQKKVAMVMQSNLLFPVSILDNITCGHEMSKERIIEACEAAQLMQWIDTLPNGLNTFVGERGGKVSGGQAQRIAIARAIAKNASIILLDEATSALDEKTGELMICAMNSLTRGKTVINVSHRKEALIGCDEIYHLENGRLGKC